VILVISPPRSTTDIVVLSTLVGSSNHQPDVVLVLSKQWLVVFLSHVVILLVFVVPHGSRLEEYVPGTQPEYVISLEDVS